MKKLVQLMIVVTMVLTSCFNRSDAQVKSPKFQKKLQWLLRHDVKEVSVSETQKLKNVTYLDAREKEEYNVSHIENAVWIGYDDFDINRVSNLDTAQTIVIYCSVGYRSEKIANKLEDKGFAKVYNLYGGIFEWYNEGLPVVTKKDKTTDKVHTYNKKWSQWVKERKEGDAVY